MFRSYLRAVAVPFVVIASLSLAACGGSAAPATTAPASGGGTGASAAEGAVKATLKEFTITLAPTSAKAGAVKVDATNAGTLPHELIFVKSDLAADKLAVKDGNVDMNALKAAGTIAQFDAGKSASGSFTLTAGKYVVFCNIAGHYVGGMRTTFTVE